MARPVAPRIITLKGAWSPRSFAGYFLLFLVECLAVYAVASIAIDSGNLLWYVLGLFLLVVALQNGWELTRTLIRYIRYKRTHA